MQVKIRLAGEVFDSNEVFASEVVEWKPDEIKACRLASGLSRREFAKIIGISRVMVWYLESGKKSPGKALQEKLTFFASEVNKPVNQTVASEPVNQTVASESVNQTVASEPVNQIVDSEPVNQIVDSEPVNQIVDSEPVNQIVDSESEVNQVVATEEGEQNVTSEEGEQNVTSEEEEQIVTSDEQEQIITSENESITLSFGGQAENIAQVSCFLAALEYLSYGWSVIPLCPPDCSPDKVPWHWRDKDGKQRHCAHPGKVPLLAWTVYQERLPTEEEVEQWFSKWPFANVGIVTGRVSNLLVVDFDDNIAIDAIKKFGGFLRTPEVKTGGGGQHNYFQHPYAEGVACASHRAEGLIANFAGKLKSVHPDLEKIDFRADGGQVVAPPSLHVSGNRYVWTVPPCLCDARRQANEVKPPSLPKWFIDLLEQKPTEVESRKSKVGRKEKTSSFTSEFRLPPSDFFHSPPFVVKKASRLPDNFEVLKKCDSLIKSLWSKPSSKVSKKGGPETSDYDWALGRACIERGIRNRDDLATILAHFPHGKYARDLSDYNLALTVESLLKTVPHLSKEDAENVLLSLRKQLNTQVTQLKEREVLVVRATPGLGKTTEIIEVIKNSERKVILAEPTKEMARTVFEQFLDDTALLKGRDSTCCMRYSQVQAIAAKGYMPGKVICPSCPYSPSNLFTNCCEYFRQFFNPTRVKVTTYEQALELHFAGKLNADLLVLDEDPSRALFKKVEITANQLHFPKDAKYPLPTFGHLMRDTLHYAEEKAAGQTKAFRCSEIVSIMTSVAKKRRIKLKNLLRLVSDCIDKVFDQPARLESLKEEEISALPHAYVGFLASSLLSEIDKAQKVKGDTCLRPEGFRDRQVWNSRLTLVVSGGRARFLLREVRKIKVRTPIVVLDAYANKDYYRKLLGRDVRLLMFDAQSHCEVMTIPLNTSKKAFQKRKENLFDDLAAVVYRYSNPVRDRRDQQRETRDEERHPLIPHSGQVSNGANLKILVYTYLFLKEDVEKMFPKALRASPQSPFVSVEHFWSGRGKDCWRDYDVVIIFGTPEPNPSELFDDARALYADDENPISLAQSKNDPRKYADSRLQNLRFMRREDEIMQDVHRIRPIWGKGLDKKVVIMSQLYCPQLPPDKIVDPKTIDKKSAHRELRKERLIKLIEACIKEYGFYFDGFAVAAGLIKTTGGGVCMQGFDGVSECMDTGFRELYDGLCEKRGGVGERMDTGLWQVSYKNILIRESPQTSNDAGSASYGGSKKEYIANRDAILAELGVSFHRASVIIDGVWRPYKIWGDKEKAKAFFGESRRIGTNAKPEVEKQKEEEEKAPDSREPAERDRREYEAEVHRELDEEILRYKDTLDYEEPNI